MYFPAARFYLFNLFFTIAGYVIWLYAELMLHSYAGAAVLAFQNFSFDKFGDL